MGKDLSQRFPQAAQVFEVADRVTERNISTVCFAGPEDALTDTANAQPGLLATSVAALRAVEDALPQPAAVAGHSLGEYTALVAAGALDFAEAVRLVEARAKAMQAAAQTAPGAMSAILGSAGAEVERIAADAGVVVANWNSPGQMVVSGDAEGVGRVEAEAARRGAKVVRLNVSGAFHSPLMQPAADAYSETLADASVGDAQVPVYCNVDAEPHTDAEELRAALARQVRMPVLWEQSVKRMAEERAIATFLEFGGRVVSGLVKRIVPEARILAVYDVPSAEALLKEVER